MSVNGRWGHTNDNDWNTPRSAWEEVFPLLDKTKRYWLPFYNDGYCGRIWEENGFDVIHQEEDFWDTMYPETIVVDNPPYKVKGIVKVKEKIMLRLCRNNIPFCLLFPTTTIHTGYFKGLEDKYGKFQLIVPSRKIDYEKSSLTEKVSVKSEAQSRPEVGDIRNFFTPTKKTKSLPLDAYDYHTTNGELENSSDEEDLDTQSKGDELKSNCPFYTIWICWNMNFPKDMMVV
jgi:hypothetical protein